MNAFKLWTKCQVAGVHINRYKVGK